MKTFLEGCGFVFNSEKFTLPTWVGNVKLDVGLSSNAPQSELWLQNDSETFVFGFEPVLSNLNSLRSGESDWPIKLDPERIGESISLVPCALGSKSMVGLREIFVTNEDSGRSSLLHPVKFSISRQEVVSVFTLASFLELFPFDRISSIDHLKIDVQGSDFEVLKGTSRFLRKISVVTVEVDQFDYENTTNDFKKIRFFMLFFGHVYTRHPKNWNKWFQRFRIHIRIDTHDPTFINVFHLAKFRKRSLTAIQAG
jgi:FkbM family methyltransferase